MATRCSSITRLSDCTVRDNDNSVNDILDQITLNPGDATQESMLDIVSEDDRDGRTIFTCNSTNTDEVSVAFERNPDSDDDKDDDVGIGEVFEEIRQRYGEELPKMASGYARPVPEEISVVDIEERIDNLPQETQEEERNTSCANCCLPRRVENVASLEKGQHIRFPGERLKINFRKKLIKVYHHHAIVKRVNKISENSVEHVLIHFSRKNGKITIHEATNTYDLEKDEIHIIDYERPRYDPERIVQRAESMVPKQSEAEVNKQFRSYNVLCCNCEHFASWCVVGEGESFQAKGVLKSCAKIFSKIAGTGCKIGRFLKRFLYNASDEFASGFNVTKHLPITLLGVTALVYLIYTIAMTISYRLKYSKGQLCKVCFKREVICLWTSFGAFCVTSGLSYILVHFLLPLLSPTFAFPLLFILVVLSVFLQWGIGKVIRALMSPYACDKIEVKKLSQITPGSMISFKYFGFSHYAIVTGKHVESDESETGTITCVHYGLKGLNIFGTREVIEESFELNVNENIKDVKLVDCRHLKTFPPTVVILRVKERIGETTWSPLTNRSDHLCFDAIVQEDNDQESHHLESDTCNIDSSKSKPESSLYVGKKELHRRSDLKTGHIVKLEQQTEIGATRGIVVWIEDKDKCSEHAFKMDLIVYRDYWAVRRKYSVDLKRERLFIKKYHPAHCCPFDKRVVRACQKEGKKGNFWTEKGFLESCILK